MFISSTSEGWRNLDQWREADTRVVEGPAGRYRELTVNRNMHYFAYRYRVERLYAPHLAVVEWPERWLGSITPSALQGIVNLRRVLIEVRPDEVREISYEDFGA